MRRSIDIFFATTGGNARKLAKQLAATLEENQLDARVANLRDSYPQSVCRSDFAVFFVSTWGEGDPPPDAEAFFAELGGTAQRFDGLSYCVVGLGDSCFARYCGAASTLGTLLSGKGARELLPVRKLDVRFQPGFLEWQEEFVRFLRNDLEKTRSAA